METTETENETVPKKLSLEEMSKEDLIKKCRSILVLTQKAKQSKDETFAENVKLKRELTAAQDMVNSFLEQKIETAQKLDQYKTLMKKYSELENKNESLERQITRLTAENNDLLAHLEKVEKQIVDLTEIGMDQRNKLFRLLKQNDSAEGKPEDVPNIPHDDLKTMLTVSLEEIKSVRQDRDNLKSQIETVNEKLNQQDVLINDLTAQIDLKNKNIEELVENLNQSKACGLEFKEKENALKCEIEKLRYDASNKNQASKTVQNELEEYKRLKIQFEEKFNALNNELTASNEKCNHLKIIEQKYSENEKKLIDLRAEIDEIKSKTVNCEKFDEVNLLNEKYREKIVNYRMKLKKLASAVKELKSSKQHLLETVKDCNTSISTWKTEIILVLKTITELSVSTNDQNQQKLLSEKDSNITELLEENKLLKEKINSLNTEEVAKGNDSLLNNVQELSSNNHLLQTGKLALSKTISNLQKKVLKYEGKSYSTRGVQTELQDRNKEIQKLQAKTVDSDSFKEINRIISQIINNNPTNQASFSLIDLEDSKENILLEKVKLIEPIYSSLKDRIDSLEKTIENLKETSEAYDKNWKTFLSILISSLEGLKNDTWQGLEGDQDMSEDAGKVFDLILDVKCRLDSNKEVAEKEALERNINGLSKELNSLSNELVGYQKSEQEFNEKYDSLQTKYQNVFEEKKMIENLYNTRVQELDALKITNENLKQEILKLNNDIKCLEVNHASNQTVITELNNEKDLNENLQKDIDSIQAELKSANEQNANINEKLQEAMVELNKLQSENEELNKKWQILSIELHNEKDMNVKSKREIDFINDELKTVIEENTILEETISKLQLENESLDREVCDLQDTNESVNAELQALKKNNESEIKTEFRRVEKLLNVEKENVDGLALQINAMETELKCEMEQRREQDSLIEKLTEELDTEKELNSKLTKDIEVFKADMNSNNEQKSSVEEKYEMLHIQNESKNQENEFLKSKIDSLNKEIILIKEENGKLNERVLSQKSQNETQLLELQEKYSENCEIINELNQKLELQTYIENEIQELKKENAELKKIVETEKAKQLDKSNIDEIKSQKIIIDELKKTNSKCAGQIESLEKENSEMRNQISILKTENSEIIKEMQDMVKELKIRGENVSKYQNLQLEFQVKFEKLDGELEKCKNELSDKERMINELQDELENTKEKLFDDSISTSTISRSDDSNRFAEIEGTWEERYNKLKLLAVKLKKKTVALNDEMQNLGTLKLNLEKTIFEQNLEIENLKKDLKDTENEKLRNVNLQSGDPDVQRLIETLNKEKQQTKNVLKEFKNEIKSLKKERETDMILKKELENNLQNQDTELKNKDKQLQDEINKHKATKDQLAKINKESKKKSVLNLEMEDYERSLKEVSLKLKEKQIQISELEKTIDTHSGTINTLREQIRSLDDVLDIEKSQSKELKNQLNENRSRVQELEELCIEKDKKIRSIENMLETKKASLEEVNVQLSKIVGENQKNVFSHKTERDQLRAIVLSREEKIRELTENLDLSQQEMSRLHEEFDKYKIRATNILRQNKEISSPSHDYQRLTEESIELKIQIDTLNTKNGTLSNQMKSVKSDYEKLKEEKVETENKYQELLVILQNLKKEHDELMEVHMKQTSDHNEALRAQKIRNETLSQCYKQQITELEEKHAKDMKELQMKLHKQPEFNQKQTQINKPPSYLTTKSNVPEVVDINFMKREDAEGSESIDSASFTSQPIPLDQLLSNNANTEVSTQAEVVRPLSPGTELRTCKEQLIQHKAQVTHLTGLLSDTEKDVAKLSQLNEILKEEIRRHQRSIEREQHAENLEYMKNVVFKFITSGNGDEKSHLVPVLNTILKLSPEETQKLNAVAKGIDPVTGRAAWSNYFPLPKWPGT